MKIRADSTEYATATVTADRDLTGKTVEVALPKHGDDPVTFHVAEEVGVAVNGDGTWTLTYRLLIGPDGTVTLTPGGYDWIVRVTDYPEIPVRKAGAVIVA